MDMNISGMKNSVVKKTIKGQEYYTFDLPMQGGARKRLYGKSEAEVLKKAEEYEVPDIPDGLSVGRLYAYFLGLNGFGTKKNRIFREAKDFLPDEFLEGNAEDCGWGKISDLIEQFDGKAEKEKVRVSLTDFCTWGFETGKMKGEPVVVEINVNKKYMEEINDEQFLKMKKAVLSDLEDLSLFVSPENSLKFRYTAMTAFVCCMGLRIQDVLRVKGLRYETDTLYEGETYYLDGLDSDVPVPEVLVPYAEKLIELKSTDEGCLFGSLNRVTIAKTFDDYGKRISLSLVTPVTVRRAFGRHLLLNGANLITLSDILHDDLDVVAKLYENEMKQNIRDFIEMA